MSEVIKFINTKNFNKSNYFDAIKYIVPKMYFEDQKEKEIDVLNQVINSNLATIYNFTSVVNILPAANSIFSGINTPEGISQFFVKQNNLTNISHSDFEKIILVPMGKSFRDFETSAEFSNFLTTTLLPGIRLNQPTIDFVGNSSQYSNHIYLINNLSWIYFLNFGSQFLTYSPSAYSHDLLVNNIYNLNPVLINDGIKGLTTYIWKNYQTKPEWQQLDLIPEDYSPLVDQTFFTSGTQQLDKLLTLIDIVYSPLYLDYSDTRVRDAINDFLENNFTLTEEILTGPFSRLLKAFSFSFADYTNSVDQLEVINDLTLCRDEHLPYLAKLIGWRLFGSDPDRWRLQLSNALNIYKTAGTKKSIQFAVDAVLGQEVFDVSSKVSELWESYIPNLIYYALATESSILKDLTTFTPEVAQRLGIRSWNPGQSSFNVRSDNMDENIKLCVDQILYSVVLQNPNNFIFNNEPFPIGSSSFQFNYRGSNFQIPPFEEYPYYVNCILSRKLIEDICAKLICFGVRESFVDQLYSYILSTSFDLTENLQIKNNFLLFTSSINYPPNFDEVMKDLSNDKSKYIPLWSGKSSHFRVIFDASSFDFTKTSLEADSKETLIIAAQAAKEFSPAHSIPEIITKITDSDIYEDAADVQSNFISLDRMEHSQLTEASGSILSNFAASAVYVPSYKRGFTATSVATFSRGDVDQLSDSFVSPDSTTANVPRRSHRRRNYKNLLPVDGMYTRTGFNMPVANQDYDVNERRFLVLGLIPSAMDYIPITDYNNLPPIYTQCENLNSSSIYSGLAVSNTYPVRGLSPIAYY